MPTFTQVSRIFPRIGLLLAVAMLSACASEKQYTITLKDGREFYALNRPEYHAKTGYYKFKNSAQKNALLRAEEVLMIHEM